MGQPHAVSRHVVPYGGITLDAGLQNSPEYRPLPKEEIAQRRLTSTILEVCRNHHYINYMSFYPTAASHTCQMSLRWVD